MQDILEEIMDVGKALKDPRTDPPVEAQSGDPGAQDYNAAQSKPPVMNLDVAEVNHYRRPPGGTRWRFEKTIYQNRHIGNFRRIVHLFVRVDNIGSVVKVSSLSKASQDRAYSLFSAWL
jgi:hypothetical protein